MEDAELLAVLHNQPELGCKYLLEQYTGLVLGVIRHELGGICTAEDMEELAADVLFAFYRQRGSFSTERGTIRGLLCTIARRRCVDWHRAHSGKPLRAETEADDPRLTDPAPTPDAAAESAAQKQALRRAMDALPPQDRELLIRKYFCGETAAEIAAALSLRTNTVEVRLSRARKRLKVMMGGAEI